MTPNPARDAYRARLEQRRNPPAMVDELLRTYFPDPWTPAQDAAHDKGWLFEIQPEHAA